MLVPSLEVAFSARTQTSILTIPNTRIISIIKSWTALLEEAILHRGHYIEPEHWEHLSCEDIQKHPLPFMQEDLAHMSTHASVLLAIAEEENLISYLATIPGFDECLAKMEGALGRYATWLSWARTLSSRHQGAMDSP